jgi:mannosyl-3-phosphoglycerate phosphatase
VLDAASLASQCPVRGFHQMTVSEVAETCDMPVEMAALAKMREYDEPFQALDPSRSPQLVSAIEREGLRWTRGGRFWHIMGPNDKAIAVLKLASLLGQAYGKVMTIGLGDGINDAPFLRVVDHAIIMPSPFSQDVLKLVPGGILATHPGPRGWNDAVLAAVSE